MTDAMAALEEMNRRAGLLGVLGMWHEREDGVHVIQVSGPAVEFHAAEGFARRSAVLRSHALNAGPYTIVSQNPASPPAEGRDAFTYTAMYRFSGDA